MTFVILLTAFMSLSGLRSPSWGSCSVVKGKDSLEKQPALGNCPRSDHSEKFKVPSSSQSWEQVLALSSCNDLLQS